MQRNAARLAVVLTTTAALALQGGPASARTTTFQDPVGDTNNRGLMDISRVTVTNTSKQISVKFRVPKAESLYPSATLSIYLDTNRKHKGPEYVWGAGIPGDSAFTVIKKNGKYGKTWAGLVEDKKCGKTVKETFDLDAGTLGITVKKKKGCLGNVKSLRTSIQTTVNGEYPTNGDYDQWVYYDQNESDFYPAKKKYSAWVNR